MRHKARMAAWLAVLMLLGTQTMAEPIAPLEAADFVLTIGETAYALGEPAAPLLTAMESAEGPFAVMEADSCMFDGTDREYENDAFLVATYPIGPNGADQVETVFVLSEAYPTARGIAVGMSRAAVIAAYGEGYTQDYDQMIYALGDPYADSILVFVLDLTADCVSAYYMMRNTAA